MRYCIILLLGFVVSASTAQQVLYPVKQGNRWGYIDRRGNMQIAPRFFSAGIFNKGLAPVREEGTFGYINASGEMVIPAAYDIAYPFYNDIALVYIDGKSFLINTKGEVLFQHPYHRLYLYSKTGVAVAETYAGRKVLINMKGELLSDTVYKSIRAFNNGLAVVQGLHDNVFVKSKGYVYETGVIDSTGKTIVGFGRYKKIDDFVNGYARVTLDDDSNDEGYINTAGQLLFTVPARKWHPGYNNNSFHDGLLVAEMYSVDPDTVKVWTSSKRYEYMGAVDPHGALIFSNKDWTALTPFSSNRAFAQTTNEDWYLVNTKGEKVNNTAYKRILYGRYDQGDPLPFVNGVAFVLLNNQWTGIDTMGNTVITQKDLDAYDYTPVRAGSSIIVEEDVSTEDNQHPYRYGFWNTKINRLVGPAYDYIEFPEHTGELIRVGLKGKMGYINDKGNMIWMEQDTDYSEDIQPLNIDYMNRVNYDAASPYRQDLARFGGWARSDNASKQGAGKIVAGGSLSVVIDDQKETTWNEQYRGMRLYVANTSADTIFFEAMDSRLYLKLQAKDKNGVWRDIEYMPSSWCGNSYHMLYLSPKEYWQFTAPEYEGSYATVIRAKLLYKRNKDDKESEVIYSNEIKGSVNPAQFWNKLSYRSAGLMDSYGD